MTTLTNSQLINEAAIIGSHLARIDPDNFRNQSGAAIDDGNDEATETDEEIIDDEGDSTDVAEHDHHQDDNYALGGHVTRSGSV